MSSQRCPATPFHLCAATKPPQKSGLPQLCQPHALVQRRTPGFRALLGSVRGQERNESRFKAPGAPTASCYPCMSALEELWDRRRTNTQVLQTQPEPALAHTQERGATGGVRSTSLPGQHTSPVPFCKGILAMRDGKKKLSHHKGWSSTGTGAGEAVGSPAGDAQSWLGAVQPDLTGTDLGQSRDAYRCLPARLSLCFPAFPPGHQPKPGIAQPAPVNAFQRHTKPLAYINLKLASSRQVMRAPLSCQDQEKKTERKCFQGRERLWGQGARMSSQASTRSWSSHPLGLSAAMGLCFPKTAL